MSYDLDAGDRPVFRPPFPNPDPRDLEVIVTMLELAAIDLTDGPDSTFTEDDLLDRISVFGADEIGVDRGDARIVLRSAAFVVRGRGGRLRLR